MSERFWVAKFLVASLKERVKVIKYPSVKEDNPVAIVRLMNGHEITIQISSPSTITVPPGVDDVLKMWGIEP